VAVIRRSGKEATGREVIGDETLVFLLRGGLSAAAHRKSMSMRTLRRRVSECGTTVTEIVRQARRALAIRLLRQEGQMTDIASSLGYESGRCFLRFIRREFGVSPTELREEVRRDEGLD
jgi:AraC-like DNA-binding protein